MSRQEDQFARRVGVDTADKDVVPSIYVTWQVDVPKVAIQFEIGPLYTKLSLNGHNYYFDHVTCRLLEVVECGP